MCVCVCVCVCVSVCVCMCGCILKPHHIVATTEIYFYQCVLKITLMHYISRDTTYLTMMARSAYTDLDSLYFQCC